jgi:hypothetical protein
LAEKIPGSERAVLNAFGRSKTSPATGGASILADRDLGSSVIDWNRIQEKPIHRPQVSARWKNSCNAPAAPRIGQAEITAIITKNTASMTNSRLFSFLK